jgi:signal peptidase II
MSRVRALTFVAILLLSAGCDHATKQIAQHVLADAPVISLAADTLRFELAYNHGGFLSVGVGLPEEIRRLFFLTFVPLALIVICWLVLRMQPLPRWSLVGLALVAGGGFANWLDRIVNEGAVTDFVSLGVGPLRTGIFNLADIWVTGGAILLLVAMRAADARDAPSEP